MRVLLVLLSLSLVSCDEGPPDDLAYEGLEACEDPAHGTEAYFTETMLPDFFTPYCLYCHSSERSGEERHGAPEGFDLDRFASATSRHALTWSRVASGEMPPLGALPSAAEYAMLVEFLNCTSVDNSAFEPDLGACPDPSLTYADAAPVFEAHCTRCHDSSLTDAADRSFAPAGRDWDVASSIRDATPALLWQRVFDGGMPQDRAEPLLESHPEDARLLYDYLSCGAPD